VPLLFPNPTAQDRTTQRSWKASRAALPPLHLWHLASLDAPTVALAWAFSFAWAAGTHLTPLAAMVIALGVWTVYVGDRLLDAKAALRQHAEHRLRERHCFHWRHRRAFVPLAVLTGAAAAVLVLGCIPAVARERDSVLAAASLVYFARVHQSQHSAVRRRRPFFPPIVTKELLVGVLFAVGCALPTLGAVWSAPATTLWGPRWVLIGCVALFAALAWLNCHAIEQWETGAERRSGFSPARFAFGLASLSLGAALLLSFAHLRPALLLAAASISALLIALLDRIRSQLAPVTLRAAVDLVLLAPAIVCPIARLVR
jgi:hypothetical protein